MDTIVQFLFLDDNRAFLSFFLIVGALVILEVISMVLGSSLSELGNLLHIDKPEIAKPDKPEFGGKDGVAGFLDWMNAGHVPFTVFFATTLMAWSILGFILQWIVFKIFGVAGPWALMVPMALIPTIMCTRELTRWMAYLVPREFTTAVFLESLEGKVGPVTIQANPMAPGQAKVKDDHGQTHYVRIVPEGDEELKQGDDVVLLDSTNHIFKARKV